MREISFASNFAINLHLKEIVIILNRFQDHPTQPSEFDSYESMIDKHCNVTIMPNHCVDKSGLLKGFMFSTNPENLCQVLPINSNLFECICMFEVNLHGSECQINPLVLRLLNNTEYVKNSLDEVIASMKEDIQDEASLDCLPEECDIIGNAQSVMCQIKDSRVWKPSLPSRLGLYHAFVRNKQTCKRDHKLFIVVRGGLPSVTEEIYNMWHDVKTSLTCAKFVECEELQWVKDAVVRNHSRVAALISQKLNLEMPLCKDYDLPGSETILHVKPTTVSFVNDLRYDTNRNLVEYVCGGCFTNESRNGILFDTLGIDGYWLFCGPNVQSHSGMYGSELRCTPPFCYPTTCAHFAQIDQQFILRTFLNEQKMHVLLPNEQTLQIFEKMGFNRNDEIVYLMDIVSAYPQQ